tara:strand:+ start:3235 stop:3381 length:147 start_codon:yes stop_codon:yes gene_type:complete
MKNKKELIKNLQNLFSWKEFYQLTDRQNDIKKTQNQIDELQFLINQLK